MKLTGLVILVLAADLALAAPTKIPVFPGAHGFGTSTSAGRGGNILKVTNLDDSGSGSLRAAVESAGKRIVVFEVGGVIKLKSDLVVRHPFITIAGQTAPDPGILIRDFGISISTSDVLIQHIAVRVGDENKEATSQKNKDNLDALQIVGGANVVVDHVSLSWSIDECLSIWGEKISDVTISNSIISEALCESLHSEKNHSMGLLVGRNVKFISIFRNLLAHNKGRNPWLQGGTSVLFANNILYNAGGTFVTVGSADGPTSASILGNVGIMGPHQKRKEMICLVRSAVQGTKLYQSDNDYPGPIFRSDANFTPLVDISPVPLDGAEIMSSMATKEYVLSSVGSRPGTRDVIDKRIINEVISRTGRHINSQKEVGGWPVYRANYRVFNEGTDPNGDADEDGYSNIEEILHHMATEVEGR